MARAGQPRGSELGAFGAERVVLDRVWGQTPALRTVTQAVAPVVGAVGLVSQRNAPSALDATETAPTGAEIAIATSPARALVHAGYELRRAHVVARPVCPGLA